MKTKRMFSDNIQPNWKTDDSNINNLHRICSRVCSFPPLLTRYFIKKHSKEGQVIFDAWSGKGTVPLEACLNGRIGIGNDRSPEAYLLTYSKVRAVKHRVIKSTLTRMKKEINQIAVPDISTEIDFNASIFFEKDTFKQILKIKELLMEKNTDSYIFIKALILGILHGNTKTSLSVRSSHSYSMSPNYVKNYIEKHNLEQK